MYVRPSVVDVAIDPMCARSPPFDLTEALVVKANDMIDAPPFNLTFLNQDMMLLLIVV